VLVRVKPALHQQLHGQRFHALGGPLRGEWQRMLAIQRIADGLLEIRIGDVRGDAFLKLAQVMPAEPAEIQLILPVEASRSACVHGLAHRRSLIMPFPDPYGTGSRGAWLRPFRIVDLRAAETVAGEMNVEMKSVL
jgi:hypothetical protein